MLLTERTGADDFEELLLGLLLFELLLFELLLFVLLLFVFVADVFTFEELHSEIETILITDTLVENWTYPLIQPKLIAEATNRGFI